MNPITMGIIIVACILALIYMIAKNRNVNSLTRALKKKEYNDVIENAQKPRMRKILGDYNCDLFMMRAYYLQNDIEHLKTKALSMLTMNYKIEQEKSFLQIYYHIFLHMRDIDMANRFLDNIVKVDDQAFIKYNQYAYNVLIEKEDDLIDTMEAEISAKLYVGFSLGTVVYLIAMQYLYKEDYDTAITFFQECLTIFHPNAIYVDFAKRHIKELEKII